MNHTYSSLTDMLFVQSIKYRLSLLLPSYITSKLLPRSSFGSLPVVVFLNSEVEMVSTTRTASRLRNQASGDKGSTSGNKSSTVGSVPTLSPPTSRCFPRFWCHTHKRRSPETTKKKREMMPISCDLPIYDP